MLNITVGKAGILMHEKNPYNISVLFSIQQSINKFDSSYKIFYIKNFMDHSYNKNILIIDKLFLQLLFAVRKHFYQ